MAVKAHFVWCMTLMLLLLHVAVCSADKRASVTPSNQGTTVSRNHQSKYDMFATEVAAGSLPAETDTQSTKRSTENTLSIEASTKNTRSTGTSLKNIWTNETSAKNFQSIQTSKENTQSTEASTRTIHSTGSPITSFHSGQISTENGSSETTGRTTLSVSQTSEQSSSATNSLVSSQQTRESSTSVSSNGGNSGHSSEQVAHSSPAELETSSINTQQSTETTISSTQQPTSPNVQQSTAQTTDPTTVTEYQQQTTLNTGQPTGTTTQQTTARTEEKSSLETTTQPTSQISEHSGVSIEDESTSLSSVKPTFQTKKSTDYDADQSTAGVIEQSSNSNTETSVNNTAFALTDNDESSNTWKIAVGVVISILLLALGLVGGYICYRRKYPVRMIIGREFAKFSNPQYTRPKHALSLVREDADFYFSATNMSINYNPVNTRIGYGNAAYVTDDHVDEEEKERRYVERKSWLFKKTPKDGATENEGGLTTESSFIAGAQSGTDLRANSERKESLASTGTDISEIIIEQDGVPKPKRRYKKKTQTALEHADSDCKISSQPNGQIMTSANVSETNQTDEKIGIDIITSHAINDEEVKLRLSDDEPQYGDRKIDDEPQYGDRKIAKTKMKLFQRPSFEEVWAEVKARSQSLSDDREPEKKRPRSSSVDPLPSLRKMSLHDELVMAAHAKHVASLETSGDVVQKVTAAVVGIDIRTRGVSGGSSISVEDHLDFLPKEVAERCYSMSSINSNSHLVTDLDDSSDSHESSEPENVEHSAWVLGGDDVDIMQETDTNVEAGVSLDNVPSVKDPADDKSRIVTLRVNTENSDAENRLHFSSQISNPVSDSSSQNELSSDEFKDNVYNQTVQETHIQEHVTARGELDYLPQAGLQDPEVTFVSSSNIVLQSGTIDQTPPLPNLTYVGTNPDNAGLSTRITTSSEDQTPSLPNLTYVGTNPENAGLSTRNRTAPQEQKGEPILFRQTSESKLQVVLSDSRNSNITRSDSDVSKHTIMVLKLGDANSQHENYQEDYSSNDKTREVMLDLAQNYKETNSKGVIPDYLTENPEQPHGDSSDSEAEENPEQPPDDSSESEANSESSVLGSEHEISNSSSSEDEIPQTDRSPPSFSVDNDNAEDAFVSVSSEQPNHRRKIISDHQFSISDDSNSDISGEENFTFSQSQGTPMHYASDDVISASNVAGKAPGNHSNQSDFDKFSNSNETSDDADAADNRHVAYINDTSKLRLRVSDDEDIDV